MSRTALRGGIAGTALATLLVAATTASAAPSFLRPEPLVDISSDGRYVLTWDGSIIDRVTTSGGLALSTRQAIDLADHAAISLERPVNGTDLYVRTPAAPRGTLANIGPDGIAVPAAKGILVRNGSALIFGTTERPARIIERDLIANTSKVLANGVSLLAASEDGKVVTWERRVGVPTRTAGKPLSADPSAFLTPTAVGYTVGGQSWVVEVTRYTQRAVGDATPGTVPTVELDTTTPTNLRVTQDGQAGGRYSLWLTRSYQRGGGYPFTEHFFDRLTATGRESHITDNGATTTSTVALDPVSGAYTAILDDKASGSPVANKATLIKPDGTGERLTVLPPAGSTDTLGAFANAIPFGAGTGVGETVTPRGSGVLGAYIDEVFAPSGADKTPWTTLPRSVDAGDRTVTSANVDWLVYDDTAAPVAGAPADYAAITAKTTGNSAGSIAVTTEPAGKLAASSVTATVSWYGLRVWSKTTKADGTLALPSIPAGIPGFKVAVKITLTDGTVLNESAALRRTR